MTFPMFLNNPNKDPDTAKIVEFSTIIRRLNAKSAHKNPIHKVIIVHLYRPFILTHLLLPTIATPTIPSIGSVVVVNVLASIAAKS